MGCRVRMNRLYGVPSRIHIAMGGCIEIAIFGVFFIIGICISR